MKYHYETEDHDLAHKIHGVIREHHSVPAHVTFPASVVATATGTVATGAVAVAPPPPAVVVPPAPVHAAPVPPPPPAPAPVVAPPPPPPAPAPVVAPPPPPPVAVSEPPPGWTVEHIKSAAEAFSKDPSKGGPAAMKTILERFGCKRATQCDPAKWPDLYAALTA